MKMAQPIIEVKNLKKIYEDRTVLDVPHLEFEAGSIYALVGPNCAGKTTLLRIINLLERPTDGEIYFDSQQVDFSPSDTLNIKRQMTLVMQNAVLFRSSVYNNIAYGLKMRSNDKSVIHSAVLSALDMVGLGEFENRKARQLSAGEAQRVALARALVLKPRILLMDEPTANVDRRNIQTVETILRKINSEYGTTIIFTTHDFAQAYRMTKNVISFLDGKIIGGGSENIFYGVFNRDANQQVFINISSNVKIRVLDYQPDSVGIYINPQNIRISFNHEDNNQLNCLHGQVISATLINGNVRLMVDIGIELVSLISQQVFREMSQVIFTQNVYTIFGISDVHVF
jgi:tungstate transport system ATP-binding protein